MPGAEAPAGTLAAFAVDKMLGRLARWLRILGHDVAYGPHLSGRTLVDCARRERRLLLTRDTRLLRDPDLPPHIFVASDHFREQLRQVADAVPLGGAFLHRCLDCNRALETARARRWRRTCRPTCSPRRSTSSAARIAGASTGRPPTAATCSTSWRPSGWLPPGERPRERPIATVSGAGGAADDGRAP